MRCYSIENEIKSGGFMGIFLGTSSASLLGHVSK